MIVTTDIQLFRILKEKLGDKEAEALVDFVDLKLKENNNFNLKFLATKEDLALTKEKIVEIIAETNENISRKFDAMDKKFEGKFDATNEKFEGKFDIVSKEFAEINEKFDNKFGILNVRIEATKAELIKWMFIFWVGQVVVTFGFILLFIKK